MKGSFAPGEVWANIHTGGKLMVIGKLAIPSGNRTHVVQDLTTGFIRHEKDLAAGDRNGFDSAGWSILCPTAHSFKNADWEIDDQDGSVEISFDNQYISGITGYNIVQSADTGPSLILEIQIGGSLRVGLSQREEIQNAKQSDPADTDS